MSERVSTARAYDMFARVVAMEADIDRAATMIIERGWQADARSLARALGDAAMLSAELEQPVEVFAQVLEECLRRARVTRALAGLAFLGAITPDFEIGPIEDRIATAQWRYLIGRSRRGRPV
jgi:hypothetical protein